jgi:hypothetical protein
MVAHAIEYGSSIDASRQLIQRFVARECDGLQRGFKKPASKSGKKWMAGMQSRNATLRYSTNSTGQ